MVIHPLLSHSFNKRLIHKKAKVKRVKIVLSTLIVMLIILIVITIDLVMSLKMFMLLNFIGLLRLNLILVILSSWFTKIIQKKLNLLLM
jgi:hypothetical protein